jgi:uncharacterized protein YukE
MQELPSADIITFPPQPTAVERLNTALTELAAALTRQQDAMHRWHDAMAELARGLHRLSGASANAAAPSRLK